MSMRRWQLCQRSLLNTKCRTNVIRARNHQDRPLKNLRAFYTKNASFFRPQSLTATETPSERSFPDENPYPRIGASVGCLTCSLFTQRFGEVTTVYEAAPTDRFVLHGRVSSLRVAGSKLVFIDIIEEGHRVQGICNFRLIQGSGLTLETFKDFFHKLRRGDIVRLRGEPHRTGRGELSLLLSDLPKILSPCLHPLPTELQDKETRIKNRHIDFLVNPYTSATIRLKAEIVQCLRDFLIGEGHVEVQTPILAHGAGGAIARSFETFTTEFPDRNISLRIAPELWLKRMVIGGFDRIFEIGPSFRNEGVDLTHNPEFMTCEFYRAYADLEDLIRLTEKLFSVLTKRIRDKTSTNSSFTGIAVPDLSVPFDRIDFIPAIEARIDRRLPDLSLPDAEVKLSRILQDCSVSIPNSHTLPQMLDRLSALYIEPHCTNPTFIVNHPECLSPLSKSFDHPVLGQRVAARAELFVNSREIVNTYEEENSPFEQRRKFLEQLSYRSHGGDKSIDESYLEALEWGLPPTGGWGCGIERLCMLLSGTNRIADVLTFGTLRNVVALKE